MPTAFETFVNDELPNRVSSQEASNTAGYFPRYTGTAKLTTERTPAQVLSDIGAAAAAHTHVEAEIVDLDHTDVAAIHDNVAAEISAIPEKVAPVGADLLLIEDSAAGDAKKRVQITNLPGGGASPARFSLLFGMMGA